MTRRQPPAVPPPPAPPEPRFDSAALYDALAATYDAGYAAPTHRRAYDQLAWQRAQALLPPPPATVIDIGCGTGRWAEWLVRAGHRVIGIEQAPAMIEQLERRALGDRFTLIRAPLEQVDLPSMAADAVFAMGSLQYAPDPPAELVRLVRWLRPGGHVALHVDSLVALVLELLRLGRTDEALLRLHSRVGVWHTHGQSCPVHLYDAARLRADCARAGLVDIRLHGLLVSASAIGSAGCTAAMEHDAAAFLATEDALAAAPLLVDCAKHIMATGRRPA